MRTLLILVCALAFTACARTASPAPCKCDTEPTACECPPQEQPVACECPPQDQELACGRNCHCLDSNPIEYPRA